MSLENRPEGGQNLIQQWEKILKEIDTPQKNEITVKEVYSIRNKYLRAWKEQDEDFSKETDGLKGFIKKEISIEDPIIRGFVEISRGKKLSLAITPDQEDAFAAVYGMDMESEVSYYALIESTGKNPKKAKAVQIKFCNVMPKSIDNIIITRALAKKLEVQKDQRIRILSVYQKTSNINLDNY